MKTIITLLFLCLLISLVSGQEMKVRFGKVSPEDLAMKVYPADTDAVAVVLSKVGRIKYDVLQENFQLSDQQHVVIKILKQAGIAEYGNAEISYYSHKNYSKVGEVKAVVHLPDGTDIKVDNSQIFDVKDSDYWSTKKITFPQLVPGAIIEYQYTVMSDGLFQPVDWYFQDQIPIVYSELTTKIPDWFDFIVLTQGLPLDTKESEQTMESVSINYFSRGETAFNNSSIQNASANVKFINNKYINRDVPALKEECCITTMDDYYSRIRYQLRAVQFPNSAREPVMHTWKEVSTRLYDLLDWGGQFRNNRPGQLVLEEAGIDLSATNHMDIANKLYSYLNHNIQWNGINSIGTGKEISTILKERSCTSGELNKVMCAALMQAGISAKPVLFSTRKNGKPLVLYPFLDQFNHMAVLARINDKDVWIDLGDKHRPLGMLRKSALNFKAWVVDQDEPYWVDVSPPDAKTVYLIKGSIDKDGNLNGTVESRTTGYHALDQRKSTIEEKEKFGDKLFMCGSSAVKISDIELINTNEIAMPFQMKANINHNIAMTTIPDKLFLNTIIPTGLDEIPFKLEERTYPIEMNYPEEISMIMDLTLPEGYVVESVPDPVKFVTENNGIQVTYNAVQNPGKINITMKYVVKQLQFDPEVYAMLKTIFNERRQKFTEQIVLTKA